MDIKFDRLADSTEGYLTEVQAAMPVDFKILSHLGDDPEAALEMWENPKSRYFRSLAHYAALGGLLTPSVREALVEGRLYVFGEGWLGWAETLAIPVIEESAQIDKGSIVLVKTDRVKTKEPLPRWIDKGVTVLTLKDLYAEQLSASSMSLETAETYLSNLGGKLVDGWWQVKFKKWTLLELRFDGSTWLYREGNTELRFRKYHSVAGLPVTSSHAMFVAVINYLITARTAEDLRGRRAFLANVFEDEITVGYSHKLLDQFSGHKLGAVLAGVNPNTFFTLIAKDGDLVRAARAYEDLGYSVFMHKGAKYIVIESECAGFARKGDKIYVAWYADKQSKLTGRNLFSVPTAGEWIED